MKILVDTNVIIDILQKREPFFADSYQALRRIIGAHGECLVCASAVTDIFYLLRTSLSSPTEARDRIEQLSQLVTFADVLGTDIHAALDRSMADFEDAVVDAVAERTETRYILTRNTGGFANSTVPAITPSDYLNR